MNPIPYPVSRILYLESPSMRYQSYLNTAAKIIGSYKGETPLSIFLKNFFAADKKYGSRDRKQIAALCYHYYRLGKALTDMPVEERIITAAFLCENSNSDFIAFHRPEWNEKVHLALAEKISFLNLKLNPTEIFPWTTALSEGIDTELFSLSFLNQPDLFIRIRPGKKRSVLEKLTSAGLPFSEIQEDCITLPNGTAVDRVLELDKEAVVQDASSQQVLNCFRDAGCGIRDTGYGIGQVPSAWDCCAASGGKSILLFDILDGNIDLTVSDIRESIISNLKKRFTIAGINRYKSFISDLSTAHCLLPTANCQLLLCDAPCTGSGTWSRTPEQLYFFKEEQIGEYAARQKQIVSNAIPALGVDGLFVYITCSVFKQENEEVVEWIRSTYKMELLQMEVLKGYDKKADSMFVALLRRAE